ncbi:hypothetical protein HMPREF3213_00570 [Heyndrickxia coagulans]|uniref:Four-carbon acid sugar kinase family protein n=1 Tax=Heyndrickxia coagulans TaxID=1398 RepID=A0A133L070_HEYCO|nr:hypothetical protein HMPREF3213_00570 [Heyndrickxia coagulans]
MQRKYEKKQERLYIIADDLTGANDAGVQLTKMGIASTVLLNLDGPVCGEKKKEVVIVDTDSRAMGEEEAYRTVYQASSFLFKQGFRQVYKKIDSTLRGNIATELKAVVAVHKPEIVVVVPSYPKMDRLTLNGIQYVNGEEVSNTEFGRDPKTPVNNSFIPDLIQSCVSDPVCLVNLETLHDSTEHFIKYILENIRKQPTWFICDAQTDRDLKKIVKMFAGLKKRIVWAGSAGLIEFLPEALQLNYQDETFHREALSIQKTFTVSASLSGTTKQQLDCVRNLLNAYFIEIDPVDLVNHTYDMQTILRGISTHQEHDHFILFVDSSIRNKERTQRLAQKLSLTKKQVSESIVEEISKIAAVVIHVFSNMSGFILTGGDTAKAVCNQLKIHEIELCSEIEAGIPLGKVSGGSREYWVVTKAGGFGRRESLVNVLNYMIGDVKAYVS